MGGNLKGFQHILDAGKSRKTPVGEYASMSSKGWDQLVNAYKLFSYKSTSVLNSRLLLILDNKGTLSSWHTFL